MMTYEIPPASSEVPPEGEKVKVDPYIEDKIVELLQRHRPHLSTEAARAFDEVRNQAKSEEEKAEIEGKRIEIICQDLGQRGEHEDNAALRALRYVRAFSRQLYGGPLLERDFDYPLMGDHSYWKNVDRHFMQYLELQAHKSDGVFYGEPNFAALPNGRSDYAQVAVIRNFDIFKSALLLGGEPIQVYYRAEPVIEQ